MDTYADLVPEVNNNDNNNSDMKYNMYTCSVCCVTFNNKLELLRHLSRIHRLTNLCRICYFDLKKIERFANPVSLRNHNLRCHREKMVQCVCGSLLINTNMLMSHLKKFKCDRNECDTEETRMVKCVCGKRFRDKEQISLHQSKCRKREKPDNFLYKSVNNVVRKYEHSKKVLTEKTCDSNAATSWGRVNSNDLTSSTYCYNQNIETSTWIPSENKFNKDFEYKEEKMDEMFRQAVVSSLYETGPYIINTKCSSSNLPVTRLDGNKENCEYSKNPVTTRMENALMNSEVLRLDNKANVCDRRDEALLNSCGKHEVDDNNNVSDGHFNTNVELRDICNSDCKGRQISTDGKGRQSLTEYVMDSNNNDVSKNKKTVAMETVTNVMLKSSPTCKKWNKNVKHATLKSLTRQKHGKRKFACKFCGHRYSKPYLYIHQKLTHGKLKRMVVPISASIKSGGQYKYRCNWCHCVSRYWNIAVQHHYRLHQDKELDLLCLTLS